MTINTTITELDEHQIHYLEIFLQERYLVADFKIVPDTQLLYDTDPVFRDLVKAVRDAQRIKDRYINDKK
jgi:hypothetical protein